MATTNFIPTLWSAKMLVSFRQKAIFAALANREYEGEAKTGNSVKITGVVDVAVKDYKAGALSDGAGGTLPRTTTPDDITDTTISLPINQEKNFDFYVDDIDAAQAAGKLTPYTDSAAAGLVEDSDRFLATLLFLQGTAVVPGAAATTAATAWNVIRDLRKALNKAKVPMGDRVFVANAEFSALLEENDSKLMQANTSGSTKGLTEAELPRILGFDGFASENLPTVNKPSIVAYHKSALAYVSQIEKTEGMRAQNKFADRLRGLHVYGGKVLRPTAVAHWTAP